MAGSSFPRIPVSTGSLTAGSIFTVIAAAVIAAAVIAAAVIALIGAIVGGLADMRFHRDADHADHAGLDR